MGRRSDLPAGVSLMKTYSPRPRDIQRRWYVIDASGAVLGRLATEVAAVLRGKHKPIFAPHADTGDHVIVVNAKGVRLTGGKESKKIAYHHSGHPGGLSETPYERLLAQRPAFAVEKAVRGMLPKNRLGRAMVKKLQVYAGPEHPHRSQKPEPLRLGEVPKWDGLPKADEARPSTRPEPSAPRAKRSTAKRKTAATPAKKTTTRRSTTSAAKKTTAKRTASTSSSASAAKTTAKKKPATRSAKSTSTKSTAKRLTRRRTKKEE
jgi:large subunit ribosomal protein L13